MDEARLVLHEEVAGRGAAIHPHFVEYARED
jgi:hypothetical protein